MYNFLKRFRRKRRPTIITPKPKHIAVIMDGNGRWANAQGLSRIAGHKKGVESVRSLIKACLHHEIPYLSIFAFSSENWNRPKGEVSALMDLLANALKTQTEKLNEYGVKLSIVGDIGLLDRNIQRMAVHAIEQTKNNNKLQLCVALNYGGRWDIVNACKALVADVQNGEIDVDDITEQMFETKLSTAGVPDPDLYIRTSGEYRISNFFLWQGAYSEFYFVDTLWPDFDEEAFTEALYLYTNRDRRFGNAVDKVNDPEG